MEGNFPDSVQQLCPALYAKWLCARFCSSSSNPSPHPAPSWAPSWAPRYRQEGALAEEQQLWMEAELFLRQGQSRRMTYSDVKPLEVQCPSVACGPQCSTLDSSSVWRRVRDALSCLLGLALTAPSTRTPSNGRRCANGRKKATGG